MCYILFLRFISTCVPNADPQEKLKREVFLENDKKVPSIDKSPLYNIAFSILKYSFKASRSAKFLNLALWGFILISTKMSLMRHWVRKTFLAFLKGRLLHCPASWLISFYYV